MQSSASNQTKIQLESLHGTHGSTCGYCHGKEKAHFTCGFVSKKIKEGEYLEMMDRGWRRCGTYFYRPDNSKSCCKMFTIRLDVTEYKMRKSHKKALRKWERFLAGEDLLKLNKEEEKDDSMNKSDGKINPEPEKKDIGKSQDQTKLEEAMNAFILRVKESLDALGSILGVIEGQQLEVAEKILKENRITKPGNKKQGDFSSNFLILFYGENRQKLQNKNLIDYVKNIKPWVEQHLSEKVAPIKINIQENGFVGFMLEKLTIEESKESSKVRGEIDEEKIPKEPKAKSTSKLVVEENEPVVVEDKEDPKKQKLTPRKFEVKLVKAAFDKESFEMYKRYCDDIHEKQKEDPEGYSDFLCLQTINYEHAIANGQFLVKGCYHQKYYVDGKLIAIGVIDMTSKCLSSVYFFYDPDYKKLSLGIIGSIKEIEFIQKMQKTFPDFKYYYLGYYIQNCQKMVYKGDYEPAQLLCPVTNNWVYLDQNLRKIIDNKAFKLSDEKATIIEDMDFSQVNMDKFIEKLKIVIQGREIKLIQLKKSAQQYFNTAFKDIVKALGKNLSTSFIYEA